MLPYSFSSFFSFCAAKESIFSLTGHLETFSLVGLTFQEQKTFLVSTSVPSARPIGRLLQQEPPLFVSLSPDV
jgi:hypothetical protein